MRKLVFFLIVVLAIFTFIREFKPADRSPQVQQAQIHGQHPN